jgi:hypothetical protein
MTKPTGSEDRVHPVRDGVLFALLLPESFRVTQCLSNGVNAAVVHGKFTFLSGEICATCDRIVVRKSGRVSGKQGPGISPAVSGYKSFAETRTGQHHDGPL